MLQAVISQVNELVIASTLTAVGTAATIAVGRAMAEQDQSLYEWFWGTAHKIKDYLTQPTMSPLERAIRSGSKNAVQELLKHKPNIDVNMTNGVTAIMLATRGQYRNFEIFSLLHTTLCSTNETSQGLLKPPPTQLTDFIGIPNVPEHYSDQKGQLWRIQPNQTMTLYEKLGLFIEAGFVEKHYGHTTISLLLYNPSTQQTDVALKVLTPEVVKDKSTNIDFSQMADVVERKIGEIKTYIASIGELAKRNQAALFEQTATDLNPLEVQLQLLKFDMLKFVNYFYTVHIHAMTKQLRIPFVTPSKGSTSQPILYQSKTKTMKNKKNDKAPGIVIDRHENGGWRARIGDGSATK
jgi:hypothetical protein